VPQHRGGPGPGQDEARCETGAYSAFSCTDCTARPDGSRWPSWGAGRRRQV